LQTVAGKQIIVTVDWQSFVVVVVLFLRVFVFFFFLVAGRRRPRK